MKDNNRIKQRKPKYKRKRIFITVFILIVILCIIGFIFVKQNNISIGSNKKNSSLMGKWTTDGNTVYEFNKNGKGALIVPVTTLPFSYKVEENKISIDFENEDSEDRTYSYELVEDKLTLKDINGTFEFYRLEE